MKYTQIKRPNMIVRAISEELRKKGIVYDKSLATVFVTSNKQELFELMTLDCIIDKEALFLSRRSKDENFNAEEYFNLQDILRIRALLEETYEVPVESLVVISSEDELKSYKEVLQEQAKLAEEVDAFVKEVFV